MWKDSTRNIVVIFQPNILRIVGCYVRHSANDKKGNFKVDPLKFYILRRPQKLDEISKLICSLLMSASEVSFQKAIEC